MAASPRIYSPSPTVRAPRRPLFMRGLGSAESPLTQNEFYIDPSGIPYDAYGEPGWMYPNPGDVNPWTGDVYDPPTPVDPSSMDFGIMPPMDPGLTPPDIWNNLPVVDPLSLQIPQPDFGATPLTPAEQALMNNLPLELPPADLAANLQLTPAPNPDTPSLWDRFLNVLNPLGNNPGGHLPPPPAPTTPGFTSASAAPPSSPLLALPGGASPTVAVTPAGAMIAASVLPGISNGALALGVVAAVALAVYFGGKR